MPDPAMLFHMIPDGPKPVAPHSHAVEADGKVRARIETDVIARRPA